MHSMCRFSAHAPEILNAQVRNKVFCTVYYRESVGLSIIRCNLSQKLVVRYPCRCRKVQFVADALPYLFGNIHRQRYVELVLGYVKKGLVERKRFDDVGILVKNGVHLRRNSFVFGKIGRYDNQFRAHLFSPCYRHCRMNAKPSGLITGRG